MRWVLCCLLVLSGSVLGQLKSPDGRYEIRYTSAGLYEDNVEIVDTKNDEVIHNGCAALYQELKYREVAWSKDSKHVALISRGTRTTTHFEILHFEDGVVNEVKIPPYMARIIGRKNFKSLGRYHWISKLRWEGSNLTFRCAGQWVDGPGDPAVDPHNWYHYDVTIEPGAKGDPKVALKALDEAIKIK